MKKNYPLLCYALFFVSMNVMAQVGVGTTVPQGALDITSVTNGILIPRVNLTAKNASAPVVNPNGGGTPIDGTLVWNIATSGVSPNNVTPGFYYWQGTSWKEIGSATTNQWALLGNSGTTAGTNFIGTTDGQDIRFKTNSNDRFNISNTLGTLQSYGTGSVNGPSYSWTGSTNTGMFMPATSNIGFATNGTEKLRIPNAMQVYAMGLGSTGAPFYSFNADPDTGIWSSGANTLNFSTAATERMRILSTGQVGVNTTAPDAVDLFTATATATYNYGINGYNNQTSGSAIYAEASNTGTSYSALEGTTYSGVGSGILGNSFGAATGTNTPTGVTGQYTGSSTTGVRIGVSGYSGNGSGNRQIGVQGNYNGFGYGIGLMGIGFGGGVPTGNNDIAVVGWRANNSNYSGYFNGNHVIANGTKSASVGTSKGNQLLYVTETPGVWFEDIGRARLVNGSVEIKLDPMFIETVFIDDTHPMSVFLQEEGDSNGLYVTIGKDGFTVKEKNGGTSNIAFSYRIMAKRLNFQDHRFGNDPVWGEGDTRKYSQYATPPPVDYNENVKFQEEQKRNYKPAEMPAGFTTYVETQNQAKKISSRPKKNETK
ncbi:hypothetical protein HUK80_13090 [Flavobacterium sp. MAH-1]|uniref:T9SS C-terminal target domain-containing protein n=1 Tax=Flavobacterium agri TaxID=2743471 RepID=A0A7Y8Y3W8_9FLAO|nr:hypothetical protein [Flavobacterium agri]NUY81836.1 hypothetical protein [Flavobacterium agri]NYA71860.1 hypothetical protein [Flavobacterium agri]